MLSLKKYIIKYGFLSRFVVLDEDTVELMKVRQPTFASKFIFYETGNAEYPLFQVCKVSSKFGIFKGIVTHGIFGEHDISIGSLEFETGMNDTGSVRALNQYNQEIGRFTLGLGFYDYIQDDKVVGKLYKISFFNYRYLLDLSKASSKIDRRIPLAFSLLAIYKDLGQKYKQLAYSKNRQLLWGVELESGILMCPNCLKTYDSTWKVCLNCSVALIENKNRKETQP